MRLSTLFLIAASLVLHVPGGWSLALCLCPGSSTSATGAEGGAGCCAVAVEAPDESCCSKPASAPDRSRGHACSGGADCIGCVVVEHDGDVPTVLVGGSGAWLDLPAPCVTSGSPRARAKRTAVALDDARARDPAGARNLPLLL